MPTALIVGAGASGFLHALALKSAAIPIAASYDPALGRAALLADLVGGRALESFDEAANHDADVVAICSPPHHHVAQAIALARPDRLTFLEKPIATTDDDLIRLSGYPNIVPTLQWRAGRAAQELRAADFGPRPTFRCDLRLWRDDAYHAARADWGCGPLLSIGIHAIDLALYVVNRPVVAARGHDGITDGEIAIDFEGGASATIRITTTARGRNELRLIMSGGATTATLLADENDPTATPLNWRGPRVDADTGATGSPLLVPYIHEAVRAFRAGKPTVSIADVAEAHRLALNVRRAIRT